MPCIELHWFMLVSFRCKIYNYTIMCIYVLYVQLNIFRLNILKGTLIVSRLVSQNAHLTSGRELVTVSLRVIHGVYTVPLNPISPVRLHLVV